jgi:hypothetical protein
MQDIQPIYSWVIDSVVAKARTSFLQDGVDEYVPCSCMPNLLNGGQEGYLNDLIIETEGNCLT